MKDATLRNEKIYGNGHIKTTRRAVDYSQYNGDDPEYAVKQSMYEYKWHQKHERKTEKEKAQDRNKKVKNNIAQRANSVDLYYFGTYSTTDPVLAKDPENFIKCVYGDLSKQCEAIRKEDPKQEPVFIAVIEPYRDIIDVKTGKIYDYFIPEKYRGKFLTSKELNEKAIQKIMEHNTHISLIKKCMPDTFKDYYDNYYHRIEDLVKDHNNNEYKEFVSDYIKDYRKTRNCFHAHVLSNFPIDFTEWIEKYKADPDCLYCAKLYENEENIEKYGIEEARRMQQGYAVEYMEKHVYLTKQLVAKGVHIYRSNIPLKECESRMFLEDNDTGETKLINENKKARDIRLLKEKEERKKESNKKVFKAYLYKKHLEKCKKEHIKAYRYLLHGGFGFIDDECKEKDVLLYGLCFSDGVYSPKKAVKRGAPSLPGVRWIGATATATPLCLRKKARFMFIKGVMKSHTGTNGVPMPLYRAFTHKINDKKSDTGLKGSPILFKKRLCSNILTKTMRYIVYIEHIPDG